MICLRPHHGMCLAYFEGKGYSDGFTVNMQKMLEFFEKGADIEVDILEGTLCVLIGGETFPKDKLIWWNFVSSSKEKLQAARDNWNAGNFPQVPGDSEIIRAPETMI
mgnify:CR=1 FL=1